MARPRKDGSYQLWLGLMTADEKARERGWRDGGKAGLTLADNPYHYSRPANQWSKGFQGRRAGERLAFATPTHSDDLSPESR